MSFAIWQVGLVIWVNTALIGTANSAFSHEFGCSIHPHLWQIMLVNWLMCHPLHRVLNHVAHPYDLCSIWDTARPWYDPESFFFLMCIIGTIFAVLPLEPTHTCSFPEREVTIISLFFILLNRTWEFLWKKSNRKTNTKYFLLYYISTTRLVLHIRTFLPCIS